MRVLDSMEAREEDEAAAVGDTFLPSLASPYRWRDWAAPGGSKRKELEAGKLGDFFGFVDGDLIPHLKQLAKDPNARPRQKVIGEALSGLEHTRVDTERNFLDVLDRVHKIDPAGTDEQHMFILSQAYEGLLLRMGEKGNDGGQFFTPREIIRAIIRAVDPQPGETIYDPCCGTGGFLAEIDEIHRRPFCRQGDAGCLERLKTRTFYGREKENLVYPIALTNLVIHGVDSPHIWHGNTLTGQSLRRALSRRAGLVRRDPRRTRCSAVRKARKRRPNFPSIRARPRYSFCSTSSTA